MFEMDKYNVSDRCKDATWQFIQKHLSILATAHLANSTTVCGRTLRNRIQRRLPPVATSVTCRNPEHDLQDVEVLPQVPGRYILCQNGYTGLGTVKKFHAEVIHKGRNDVNVQEAQLSIDGVKESNNTTKSLHAYCIKFTGCRNVYIFAIVRPADKAVAIRQEHADMLQRVIADAK